MSQANAPLFGRMIPAMITPFDYNRELDFGVVRTLVRKLIDGGSDSIVVCGTTGEGPTISAQDKLKLFSTVVDESDGAIPIIANVGGNSTADSVEFGKRAAERGIDGIMAVVPYYNKPPQEGIYQHFKALSEGVGIPMVLYNIPGRCSVNMDADTTLRLAHDCKYVVAVKEASGDMDQVAQIIDGAPQGFWVYSGDDAATYPIMQRGGTGVISTIGNVAPARMKEIVELCAAGDWDAAKQAHENLHPLMKQLFATSNPILVKEALRLCGLDVGGVRLPLIDATPEQSEALAAVMRSVGEVR